VNSTVKSPSKIVDQRAIETVLPVVQPQQPAVVAAGQGTGRKTGFFNRHR